MRAPDCHPAMDPPPAEAEIAQREQPDQVAGDVAQKDAPVRNAQDEEALRLREIHGAPLDRCGRGDDGVAQPSVGRHVVEAAMPAHDAAQRRGLERKLPDFDRIGTAEFQRELASENGNEIGLYKHGAR